jgi:cytochrome b6-f complex iron-sulfur subunit
MFAPSNMPKQTEKVEKPWGIPRTTRVEMAEVALDGEDFVPDMQRRTIMNLVLLGGAAVPVGWMGGGFVYFFVPPSGGGGGAGVVALDANGD